ncbi:MAG TPA: hypothetical protein VF483_10180 [Gemmatimonadaceae bacterium]
MTHVVLGRAARGYVLGRAARGYVLGRRFAAGMLLLLGALPSAAQDKPKKEKKPKDSTEAAKPFVPSPLFTAQTPVEFTLTGSYSKIKKERTGDANYYAGSVSYKGDDGAVVTVPVRLRARGIWRRKNCDVPPVLMNFSKDSTKKTLFAKLDRARLTFPCRFNADWEQYVLQEYELYRVQRILTPLSFDVRLAHVTFVDQDKKDTLGTWWSFLSEQDDVFAERVGAKLVTTQGANPADLERYESAFFGVFQYFVGNSDYSIRALHNVVLIMKNNEYVPVARDYDFGGAVNTRYAKPDPRLRITSVTQRLMRGYCTEPEQYEKVFALFKAKKDSIYALYSDPLSSALKPNTTKYTLKYFDEFYDVINDPKKAKKEIVSACLGGG